jgi:death-on-curing family protein
MLVFLALNQIELSYTQSELSDIFLAIAAGTYSFADLVQWILKHRI